MRGQISTVCYASIESTRTGWNDTSLLYGMTPLFYQKFLDIVKDDLTRMVNQFLFEGTMAQGLNDTNIFLIPKTTKPNEMKKFRPISICIISYKIISKVLC